MQMPLWQSWLISLGELSAAVLVALVAHAVGFRLLGVLARHRHGPLEDSLLRNLRAPARLALILIAILLVSRITLLPDGGNEMLRRAVSLAVIATVAWALMALINVLEDLTTARYDISAKNNLLARKMRTRITVIRRVLYVVIVIITLSAMLMSFPEVRALGTTLAASAGLAGLVAGIAARPVLSNLIAGMQIALTQPIRIDDVVIVEKEWGWIEEIDTAFVVVRIWDLRRLILPLTYFVEKPFQNWTYQSADLLGYVHIYADYTVSVDALRQELERILKASPAWDGKVWNLQVTGADEHALQMRALFSAADSGTRWDLMVGVREQLVGFLQARYPDSLPKTRVQLGPLDARD